MYLRKVRDRLSVKFLAATNSHFLVHEISHNKEDR